MVSRLVGWIFALSLLVGALPASAAPIAELVAAPLGPVPAAAPAAVPASPAAISLSLISRYEQPDPEASFGESAAEIVVHDPLSERLFAVNGFNSTLDVIDISNPLSPTLALTLTLGGGGPTSVAIYSGTIAVAVVAEPKTDPGTVFFFNADTTTDTPLSQVTVGALPDMVIFTPDGSTVLTANEGEPNSYGEPDSVDPEGSISVIDVSGGFASPTVATADFSAFNAQLDDLLAEGVRIFGPGATVAQDLEPEYIAVSADSSTAYVTLQENNALAIVDIATSTVSDIVPLGYKDHSVEPNGIDASDRDDAINIQTWPAVLGMYQPDAIAAYEVDGTTFLVTANEGDARDYDGFAEESRVEDLVLDSSVFSGTTVFTAEENLGRLTVTAYPTSTEVTTFTQLYAFGARSFSIWNGSDGSLVFDSGDDLERRTAEVFPNNFNASNDNNDFDNRSDNKGPEPEGVVLGVVDGRTYAFIGLERVGGVMVYDVTNPGAPTFVTYVNNRNFNVDVEDPAAGDLGPEGLFFVTAANSPTGNPLLLVASEVSGTISIFEINATTPDGAGSLTLLHNNDGESTLLPIEVAVPPGDAYGNTVTQTIEIAGVAGFKAVADREIAEARAQGKAVMNLYAGDAFLASATLLCTLDDPNGPVYDAIAQQAIPYTAHILGNHEFDYSPDFLERFIRAFGGTQPFLSANLNFEAEPGFADLLASNYLTTTSEFSENRVIFSPIDDGGVVGGSLVYTDTATGQRFGIVGLTTESLPTISTPRNVEVTSNLTETVAVAQEAIDLLYDELGVRKIIFASHLQDVDNDIELVSRLRNVDIAVAGGGDDLLVNTAITATLPITRQLLPGDEPAVDDDGNIRNYPVEVTDPDGRTVYIVTSDGNYKYLGRFDVNFDADGEITEVITEESYPRRVVLEGEGATALGLSDAVAPDEGLVEDINTPIEECLAELEAEEVVRSEVVLDVSRNGVRSTESNAGNSITDSFLYVFNEYADNVGLPTATISNPVIAVQNGGGIRQNAGDSLPTVGAPGTLSRLDTFNVLPFANFVTVISDITPLDLETILERSAASLPGAGGQFLQVAGFSVAYNPDLPVGSRVISATLDDGRALIRNGEVVDGAPTVRVVTNNFTAEGGDNYPTFAAKTGKTNLIDDEGVAISYEQAWREYLLTFPVEEGLPTIQSDDARYAPGGEGRITFVEDAPTTLYLPIIGQR